MGSTTDEIPVGKLDRYGYDSPEIIRSRRRAMEDSTKGSQQLLRQAFMLVYVAAATVSQIAVSSLVIYLVSAA